MKPKKKPLKSASLHELELADVKFVKPTKDGEYAAKKSKKQATHKIETTPTSTLAVPLKKWKHKSIAGGYGEPKISEEQPKEENDHSWHPAIPAGASWIEYSTSKAAIMLPISELNSLRGFRGLIRFGRLRYNEDFVSMMPGENGNITFFKDGRTAFAEGNTPEEIKQREKSAAERAERIANPPAHVKEAFAKQAEARRAPAGPRPGDVAGVTQCGVTKPKSGGATAAVWEACDDLLKALGRCPSKAEVLPKLPKMNPGTVGTQHSAWRRFHGLAPAK